jgi:hypothetical protein
MTADDESTRIGRAVEALTEACFTIALRFDVCALCLMYEAASIAEEAEEAGEAHHRGTPRQTHPTHKTVL